MAQRQGVLGPLAGAVQQSLSLLINDGTIHGAFEMAGPAQPGAGGRVDGEKPITADRKVERVAGVVDGTGGAVPIGGAILCVGQHPSATRRQAEVRGATRLAHQIIAEQHAFLAEAWCTGIGEVGGRDVHRPCLGD